jgi:hypothetical protein
MQKKPFLHEKTVKSPVLPCKRGFPKAGFCVTMLGGFTCASFLGCIFEFDFHINGGIDS